MKFEQSRPDHEVHEVHRPHGHGLMDQKHQKGMRSPIAGSVPMAGAGTAMSVDGTGGETMPSDQMGDSMQGMR